MNQTEHTPRVTVRNDFAAPGRFSNIECYKTWRENQEFFAELRAAPRPTDLPALRHPAIDALRCPLAGCDAPLGQPCFDSTAEHAHYEREAAWVRGGTRLAA